MQRTFFTPIYFQTMLYHNLTLFNNVHNFSFNEVFETIATNNNILTNFYLIHVFILTQEKFIARTITL